MHHSQLDTTRVKFTYPLRLLAFTFFQPRLWPFSRYVDCRSIDPSPRFENSESTGVAKSSVIFPGVSLLNGPTTCHWRRKSAADLSWASSQLLRNTLGSSGPKRLPLVGTSVFFA